MRILLNILITYVNSYLTSFYNLKNLPVINGFVAGLENAWSRCSLRKSLHVHSACTSMPNNCSWLVSTMLSVSLYRITAIASWAGLYSVGSSLNLASWQRTILSWQQRAGDNSGWDLKLSNILHYSTVWHYEQWMMSFVCSLLIMLI